MGKNKKIDHDQIFKTLFREFFKEFLEGFLPKVAEEIDFSKIEFLDQEFFTDINRGRKKLMDMVVKVRLKKGGDEFILLHTEFESSKPDRIEFPKRMFKYFCQLYLRFGKPVIPIVVFTDDHKWRKMIPATFSINFKESEYLKFFYHSFKLKHLDWRRFIDSNNPLILALMVKMDIEKNEKVHLKADFLRYILKSERKQTRQSLLFEFVETYLTLEPEEQKEFEKLIETKKDYKKVMKMMTIYEERGIQQGMKQGIQQGMKQGIHQGSLIVAKRALKRGMDIYSIADITGLTIEEIKSIKQREKH